MTYMDLIGSLVPDAAIALQHDIQANTNSIADAICLAMDISHYKVSEVERSKANRKGRAPITRR